jgi:hypothetical protein
MKSANNSRFWPAFKSAFRIDVLLLNALAVLLIWYAGRTGIAALTSTDTQEMNTFLAIQPKDSLSTVYLVVLVQIIATALSMFVFTVNQRASSTYFSLPITRSELFFARYLAGLIMISVPHIVHLFYKLIINIIAFGVTSALVHGFAIFAACALNTILFIYSSTIFISLLVGTVREKLLYSTLIIYIANSLLGASAIVFSLFLHGNSMGETYVGNQLSDSLSNLIRKYLPPYGSTFIIERYCVISANNGLNFDAGSFAVPLWGDKYSAGWCTLIVWILLSAAICILALRAFKSYRAEYAGMQDIHPKLNSIATVLLSFALLFEGDGPGNYFRPKIVVGGLSIIWLFAMYAIVRLLMTKSIRKIFSLDGLRHYACIAALYLIIAVCGLTGGFGYSAYMPNINEIESAKITYTGSPDFIAGSGNYYPISTVPNARLLAMSESYICIRDFDDIVFKSASDIGAVLALHKKLIGADIGLFSKEKKTIDSIEDDWLRLWVNVEYRLKNGRTVDRLYNSVPAWLAEDMTKLDKTDAIAERIGETVSLAAEIAGQGRLPLFITDSLFENRYTLTTDEQLQMLSAIMRDINGSAKTEKYYPAHPARAIVSFPRLIKDGGIIGMPVYTIEQEPKRVGNIAKMTGIDENMASFAMGHIGYKGPEWYQQHTSTIRIYITDSFVDTIGFLRERGIYDAINDPVGNAGNILSIRASRYNVNPRSISQSLYFRSTVTDEKLLSAAAIGVPPDKYADILRLARTNYYIAGGGFLVWVEMKDMASETMSRTVTLFLPESDAPSYIQ